VQERAVWSRQQIEDSHQARVRHEKQEEERRSSMIDMNITEQGVASLERVDYIIVNDSTLDQLHLQIDKILAQL